MITLDGVELKRVTEIKFDRKYDLLIQFHFDSKLNDCNDLLELAKYDLKQIVKETPEDIGVFQVKVPKEYDIDLTSK